MNSRALKLEELLSNTLYGVNGKFRIQMARI